MRKIVFSAILILIVGIPLIAFGGVAPDAFPLPGCSYHEYGGLITGAADTLWFTSDTFDGGASEDADVFAPKAIPVGQTTSGTVTTQTKRVRSVLLVAMAPFSVQAFQYGAATATSGGYAWVDSLALDGAAGGVGTVSGQYPCRILIDYPDSLHIVPAVGAADSVKAYVGY